VKMIFNLTLKYSMIFRMPKHANQNQFQSINCANIICNDELERNKREKLAMNIEMWEWN
jgi:hypothetical protein